MLATDADAMGMGVVPAELDFQMEKGQKLRKTLTVHNLAEESIEVEVRSPADYLKFYHNAAVPANATGKIMVEAVTENLDEGDYQTSIYVTTRNKAAGVKFNLGAAVKANVTVINVSKASPAIGILISTTILLAGMLVYFAVTRLSGFFSAEKA